jgi:hypothetical protein
MADSDGNYTIPTFPALFEVSFVNAEQGPVVLVANPSNGIGTGGSGYHLQRLQMTIIPSSDTLLHLAILLPRETPALSIQAANEREKRHSLSSHAALLDGFDDALAHVGTSASSKLAFNLLGRETDLSSPEDLITTISDAAKWKRRTSPCRQAPSASRCYSWRTRSRLFPP